MRILCLLALILTTICECAETVGTVTAVEGSLKATSRDHGGRTLSQNSEIYLGDLLITNATSKGEIEFTDGTVLLLIPNSQYSIDAYNTGLDDNKFWAKLKRGGVRLSTGMIAKKNPENFQLNTPNATIGVRGTTFVARMLDGNLYAGSSSGDITLSNNGGSLSLSENQYGMSTSSLSAPKALSSMPDALNPSNFTPPSGGMPPSLPISKGFAWGPAIGATVVICTVVGIVVTAATQTQPTFSHSGNTVIPDRPQPPPPPPD